MAEQKHFTFPNITFKANNLYFNKEYKKNDSYYVRDGYIIILYIQKKDLF